MYAYHETVYSIFSSIPKSGFVSGASRPGQAAKENILKLPAANKSNLSLVLMGLLVIVALLPYVWNYAVQSVVIVNVIVSTIVITRAFQIITSQVSKVALVIIQDYQTRPAK